jgi:hypothetical protein
MDFKIQSNKTLWSADLMIHVKEGVNIETNGKLKFKNYNYVKNKWNNGEQCFKKSKYYKHMKRISILISNDNYNFFSDFDKFDNCNSEQLKIKTNNSGLLW